MDFELPSLSDNHIQRLKEHLLSLGWTEEEIFKLVDYLTKLKMPTEQSLTASL